MNAFIVNWNPTKWKMPDAAIDEAIEATASGGCPWSVGVRTGGIHHGDRAYLLRQHQDRGLTAEGYFTSEVYEDDHWDGTERTANYAEVTWTTWLPIDDRLPSATLIDQLPAVTWNRLQASGTHIPHPEAETLATLWEDHLEDIGQPVTVLPDELPGSLSYREGATTQVLVNRYERSRHARQACVDHHGTACAVCEFDFAATYGSLGDGYIHVHHLTDLSLAPDDYEIDPIADLRPVCPNCHAMLHRRRPALSIEALRQLLIT